MNDPSQDGTIEPIQVWRFHDAPAKLREIVEDDDACDSCSWLALLPPEYEGQIPVWLLTTATAIAPLITDEYRDDRGWIVLVGRHA